MGRRGYQRNQWGEYVRHSLLTIGILQRLPLQMNASIRTLQLDFRHSFAILVNIYQPHTSLFRYNLFAPPPPPPRRETIDKELSASIVRLSSSPKYARHRKVTLSTDHGVVNNAIRLSPTPCSTFSTAVRLQ